MKKYLVLLSLVLTFSAVSVSAFAVEQGVRGFVHELTVGTDTSVVEVEVHGRYIDGNTVTIDLQLAVSSEDGKQNNYMFILLKESLVKNKRVEVFYDVPERRGERPYIHRVRLLLN